MGGLQSIPTAFLSTFPILLKKGPLYWLYFTIPYIYLTFDEIFRKKRFDLFDSTAVAQPEKNGFFVPKEERLLEQPSKSVCLEKFSDDAFLFGTNSKLEYLAVCICRRPDQQVQCSLVLQLADGKLYYLPEEYITQSTTSEDNTFGSSRLKLQCIIPMRKWRIFFNGLLEERRSNEKDNLEKKYKHAKFSFMWTASSEVFDFSRDLSKTLLSNAIASSSLLATPAYILKKLNTDLEGYDHPGMIFGTVKVENESEKEIYLWGVRRRFMGANMLFRHGGSTEIYANLKNGSQLYLCIADSGLFKRLAHGYIMKPTGFILPIDEIVGQVDILLQKDSSIKCFADNHCYDVHTTQIGTDIGFQKEYGENSFCRTIDITMNGRPGSGFCFRGIETKYDTFPNAQSRYAMHDLSSHTEREQSTLCIPFKHKLCREAELCGGKGSSLGNLYSLSFKTKQINSSINFSVPNGLVVSTEAYKEFIKGALNEALTKFEKDIWLQKCDTQLTCKKMVHMVSMAELPENVSKGIASGLESLFGNSLQERKFAVRSSATGEDTEQMSAAGQMETFLGLKTIPEVLNAVKKCWASQFSFQAVEYKRGYGQPLNTPMAVVIQEMVSCETAGVIFTCDPVTGNPSFISITANWGLGESVVSASADPDTVTLRRTLRNKLIVESTQVGQKKSKIIMDGESGTKEMIVDDNESAVCCVNEIMALRLGRIAVELEKFYGNPRDIEWGIIAENVFLFQSRPVTSLDIETDFETKHFFDCFQRTEKSFLTKANVGEVMPGATSPLGIDVLQKVFTAALLRRFIILDEGALPQKPYFQKVVVSALNHMFLTLVGGLLKFDKDSEEITKSLIISLFGRFIDEKEIREEAADRTLPPVSFFNRIIFPGYMLLICFFSGLEARLKSKWIKAIQIPHENMTSLDILQEIAHRYDKIAEAFNIHTNVTISSSFWNLSLLQLLAKAKGDWDQDVFSDFAYLLSTCQAVESANIPSSIQDIGAKIREEIDPAKFKEMSDEDALNWLNSNNSSIAGAKFGQFIERHGHRCLKEFDVYTNTWAINPKPVINMLKNFVSETATASESRDVDSFSTIISKLRVKLTFKDRCRLRLLLPNSRKAVQEREYSKSLGILIIDKIRKPFRKLSEMMVAEGRLPRKELLFFLCIDEIQQLIETHSPRLVAKAMRRYKVHEELDKLLFPEICTGIPKPETDTDEIEIVGKGFKMTGVPVSQGVVKAPARVVMNLEEATSIKQGDVLITYSTDIGWSPYFPLLSGIVTELGGLISHGAVVAREYGLPCVVSLHGATRALKSGDMVILDGNNGTLQKVDDD